MLCRHYVFVHMVRLVFWTFLFFFPLLHSLHPLPLPFTDSVLISGDMEGTIRLHKVADCTQLEAFKTGSNSQVCSLVTSPRPDSLNVFAFRCVRNF